MSRALGGTGGEPVGITDAFFVADPEARIATAADRWGALGKTPSLMLVPPLMDQARPSGFEYRGAV
jgi:hypothetical protein